MTRHPNKRISKGIETIIEEMAYLVAHPRIQQKTWVAKGKTWLSVLQATRQDLESDVAHHAMSAETYQGLLVALERVELRLEMRDATSWGYRWFRGDLQGAHATRSDALEAALRDRLG